MKHSLSKSLYTRGVQCEKSLWLKKHNPEVLAQPDSSTEAVFTTGNEVGDFACRLFPNGREIPYDGTTFEEKVALTQQWIDEGLPSIYEATFKHDGILVMVDILHRGENGWELYEVKSSTGVKDIYVHDASIQYYVLNGLGLNISKASIVHINNEYVFNNTLEIEKLFTIADVTSQVLELQDTIPERLNGFDTILEDQETPPTIDIGLHCSDPYECDAWEHCWSHVPKYSVFNISRLRKTKKFEMYKSGVVDFKDIPQEEISVMTQAQQVQIQSEIAQKSIINKEAISSFLGQLSYPIYHLDFETFQQAIPTWNGISPFMQIPFQFSVHVQHEDGRLEHKEFLALEGIDPREVLALALVKAIPQNTQVMAYNMSFEKGVIAKLAQQFPQLSEHLMNIHDHMGDLMIPFQNKDYYVPSMMGSYSIKYVLPALVPEMQMSYKELDLVHNGGEAMDAFSELQVLEDGERKGRLRESLLRYCELDTLAMVKIIDKLKKSV